MLEIRIQQSLSDFMLDVAIELNSFHVLAIYGASGSGKSTLLRHIAGLDKSWQNKIIYKDQTWQNEQLFIAPEKRKIGMIFQEPYFFPHLTVKDNLLFANKNVETKYFAQIIGDLQLDKLLSRLPHNLSGGEKQKVALARTLLIKPQLLLLDEPFAAIDQATSLFIIDYLSRLNIPQIIVSHSTAEVLRSADYVIHLANGAIKAHGATNDVLCYFDGFTRYNLLLLCHQDKDTPTILATAIGTIECPIWHVTQVTSRVLLDGSNISIHETNILPHLLMAKIITIDEFSAHLEITCQFNDGSQIIIPIKKQSLSQSKFILQQVVYLEIHSFSFI